MSQNDNFAGGFFWGALLGGVIGGVVGSAIATRRPTLDEEDNPSLLTSSQPVKLDSEESIELARRRLEDKIAQLNLAIDDVREQLGNVDDMPLKQESS